MTTNTEIIHKKWKRGVQVWLYGLASAIILGVTHSIAPMIVEPRSFNFNEGLTNLGIIALASGILGALTYLNKSPLPPLPDETTNSDDTTSG